MQLPLLLAGPLVRRVESTSAAFWVALSEPATVAVTVWQGLQTSTGAGTASPGGPVAATGSAATRAFGAHLHVAVVVAQAAITLSPGTVYAYDVMIDSGGQRRGLRDLRLLQDADDGEGSRQPGVTGLAPKHLALGYGPDRLPTFATAGPTIPDLRIMHASCRKSHGPGPDALVWVDDEIKEHLSNPAERPQQLFLTGDQVYSDDLSGCLLPMLSGIGTDLLGFDELVDVDGADVATTRLPALMRARLCREVARLSTSAADNHLIGFAEFAAMYLCAWSPHVWRGLADAADVFTQAPPDADALHLDDWVEKFGSVEAWQNHRPDKRKPSVGESFAAEVVRTRAWRDAAPKVARALANVSTYMMCDDHEVTDDWNLTAAWRRRVVTAPLGRTILRNGLMTFALFQAWGNDPAGWTRTPQAQPSAGERLLDAIEDFAADGPTTAATTRDALEDLLGLTEPVKDPQVVFACGVDGPMHRVHVLDTRTRRRYEPGDVSPPRLLGESLDDQLPKGPLAGGRELLVVVSPVPLLFPRLFDALVQPAAAAVTDLSNYARRAGGLTPGIRAGAEEWDVEGWQAVENEFEAMIRRLGTYRRVVLLSGDVHFASTLVLDFWAGADDQPDSRIVQCTSSASRNEMDSRQQVLLRALRFGQQLLRGRPYERLAWEQRPAVAVPAGGDIRPGRRARMLRDPGLMPASGWPADTTVTRPPDWRWSLRVLRDDRAHPPRRVADQEHEALPAWDTADPVRSYAAVAAAHAAAAFTASDPLRLMVFRNNVGIVSFEADGANEYQVKHTILTVSDDGSGDAFTEHTVSTAADSPAPQLRTV